jgi:hypothetical protein
VIPAIQHEAGTDTICAGSINNYFSIAEVAGATFYNWSVYPVPSSYLIDGNSTRNITFGTNNPGQYALRLAVTTDCGTASANELSLTVLDGNDLNCGSVGGFAIYPNPARDDLTVSRNDDNMPNSLADGQESAMNGYEIKLYDDIGISKKQRNRQRNKSEYKGYTERQLLPSHNRGEKYNQKTNHCKALKRIKNLLLAGEKIFRLSFL